MRFNKEGQAEEDSCEKCGEYDKWENDPLQERIGRADNQDEQALINDIADSVEVDPQDSRTLSMRRTGPVNEVTISQRNPSHH